MIRVGTVLAGLLLLTACGPGDRTQGVLCPAEVEHAGRLYGTIGDLTRLPEVTGRVDRGTRPGCGPSVPARVVDVQELRDVEPEVAVLVGDQLYAAVDQQRSPRLQRYYEPVRCDNARPFAVVGDWREFDHSRGRTSEVSVIRVLRASSDARSYVRADLSVDTGSLGPVAQRELTSGQQLHLVLRCEDRGRFVAVDLRRA